MNQQYKNQHGYIALMSAIIISAVLIVIVFATSLSGFFVRFNVLDSENKQRSSDLAESCLNVVLLRLAQNPSDAAVGTVPVGNEVCTIMSVQKNTPSAGQVTVQTKGLVQRAVTNLQVVFLSTTGELVSWEELPSL